MWDLGWYTAKEKRAAKNDGWEEIPDNLILKDIYGVGWPFDYYGHDVMLVDRNKRDLRQAFMKQPSAADLLPKKLYVAVERYLGLTSAQWRGVGEGLEAAITGVVIGVGLALVATVGAPFALLALGIGLGLTTVAGVDIGLEIRDLARGDLPREEQERRTAALVTGITAAIVTGAASAKAYRIASPKGTPPPVRGRPGSGADRVAPRIAPKQAEPAVAPPAAEATSKEEIGATPGERLLLSEPRSAKAWRDTPGVASGVDLPTLEGSQRWLRGTGADAGRVPGQIARRLAGRRFSSFDEFREAFWQEVAQDPTLRRQFGPNSVREMQAGRAPFAPGSGRLGGRIKYEIDHMIEIQYGGGVYDMNNMIVRTPVNHVGK
jgi:filamentous hemagglutinin